MFLALTLSSSSLSYGQNIGGILQREFAQAVGAGDYTWDGYPINNYGVGSMASTHVPITGRNFTVESRFCSTFRCLGREEPTDAQGFLKVDPRLVTVSVGTSVTFSNEATRKAVAEAIVPQLLHAINVDVGANFTHTAKLSISFGRLIKRQLNFADLRAYLDSLQNATDPTQKEIYKLDRQHRLVVVYADVVTDSMELTIDFGSDSGGTVKAALDEKLGNVSKVIGDNAKVDFELSKKSNGVYKIKVTEPLILARLPRNTHHLR
jgi:hypothetical protein